MALFERVFRGSDEMFAKAEAEVNAVVAELGEAAPLNLPSTAYYLACVYAYLGKKITNLGELKAVLEMEIKGSGWFDGNGDIVITRE